ncbi:hypothetical protein [uncultured Enterococcus sp.]|uniref:hypothetical protein n=1 Tax=uncultured Enterococcus sp. TaxID=167972 RepID=UPI002805760E|nr:hypothetical protein [uncultured Enterococcus sp.]
MKKSYFIRTYHIIGWLLLISTLLLISDVGFRLIKLFIQHQSNSFMTEYTQFLNKYVILVCNGLQQVCTFSIIITIMFMVPEIIIRIWKDSLVNIVKSIWLTYRVGKFLQIHATYEDERKVNRYNNAVKKAIIDVQNTTVLFNMKLPNEIGVHGMILDNKEAIREEIANRLPAYSFSNVQRVKSNLRIEGTKIR